MHTEADIAKIEAATGKQFAGYLRDEDNILLPVFLASEHIAQRRAILYQFNGIADSSLVDAEEGAGKRVDSPPKRNAARRGRPSSTVSAEEVTALARKGFSHRRITDELARKGISVSTSTIRKLLNAA
ncbi:hypothetical protein EKD04_014365 [Chloroflexales bacterium ZM16-3]|nr:hypothetical protein [Chloroflexales bacterium ZM16-3]